MRPHAIALAVALLMPGLLHAQSQGQPPEPPEADLPTGPEAAKRGTINDPDFARAKRILEPLTPEQIDDFQALTESVDRAYGSKPPPVVNSASVSVPASTEPGAAPVTVTLSPDYVSTITIFDATGAPWPVIRAQVGNGAMFGAELPQEGSNIIIITPLQKYAVSNMMVLLQGHTMPLMLTLNVSADTVQYNTALSMNSAGPLARPLVAEKAPAPVDEPLMRLILDGAGLSNSDVKQIDIRGNAETTAFMAAGKFYLRTPHELIYQHADARISAGGINVFRIKPDAVITIADRNGRSIDLRPSEHVVVDGAYAAALSPMNPANRLEY